NADAGGDGAMSNAKAKNEPSPLVTRERARSSPHEEQLGRDILGALLDFPDLMVDPEVEGGLGALDGEVALAVAALRGAGSASGETGVMRRSQDTKFAINPDDFLAKVSHSIHSFAVQRF